LGEKPGPPKSDRGASLPRGEGREWCWAAVGSGKGGGGFLGGRSATTRGDSNGGRKIRSGEERETWKNES